jgi:coenzyme F420 hydrogenase subunit beta
VSISDGLNITPPMGPAAPHDMCTGCATSRTAEAKRCGAACQLIKPDYDRLEAQVHGRTGDPARTDEQFFGPFQRMVRAFMKAPREGEQWLLVRNDRCGELLGLLGN